MTDRLDEIRKRHEAARLMISALCKPKGSEGARRWVMSIPARPDHDPDMVIAASLRDIPDLLEEVERLRNAVKGDIADAVEQAQKAAQP